MNASYRPAPLAQLRQQAQAHIDGQQWRSAQAVLEAILRDAPNDLASSIRLADVLFRQGQLQASTAPLLGALGRLPKDAPLIVALVNHLVARGEIVAARACLDLLAHAPDPPAELQIAQANLRFTIGQIHEALEPAEKAVLAGMGTPEAWRLYAMLLQFHGRIDEACEWLEKSLDRWPDFADAAPVLVDLRKQRPEANYLARFDEQLERMSGRADDAGEIFRRAEFEYARFKTLDDLGRYGEAWQALAHCNALMHKLNPYLAGTEEALTDALLGLPTSDIGAGVRAGALEGPTPIFIVGMPRSGTTLLDRILSSHSLVASAGEIVDFWRQLHWVADVVPSTAESLLRVAERSHELDFRQLGMRYLKQTQWRAQGRSFYIDKLPGNIQMVAFIRRALPHAPILHIVRDPMDTCFSNFKAMFGNASPYCYELEALAHYYRQYTRLAGHWRGSLPGAMLEISYASLVQQPAETIGHVLAHCGLPMEASCLQPERNASPVATRSSPQVRESIHTRGLGQWRHYAAHLAPLEKALHDIVGDSTLTC